MNVVPQKLTEFIFNGDNSKDSLCAVDYYMDKLELILRSTTDSASFSDCIENLIINYTVHILL